jgi:hypothetical protein
MSSKVKQVLSTGFLFVTFIGLIYLYLTHKSLENSEVILIPVILIGLIGIYSITKNRQTLEEIVKLEDKTYKIFLVGRSGVGKTTFVKTGFSLDDTSKIKSTDVFQVYKNVLPLTLKESQGEFDVKIKVADYRGQDPNQIVHDIANDAQSDFFGQKEKEINSIVLIADLFPRGVVDDEILNNETLLEFLKTNTLEKLQARVQENYSYIGDAALPIFFRTAYGSRLKSVRLIINKVNLLEELVKGGFISLGEHSPEDYAKNLYEDMSNKIAKVCEDLKIEDFSTIVASTKDANDTRSLLSGLLCEYGGYISQKYKR